MKQGNKREQDMKEMVKKYETLKYSVHMADSDAPKPILNAPRPASSHSKNTYFDKVSIH